MKSPKRVNWMVLGFGHVFRDLGYSVSFFVEVSKTMVSPPTPTNAFFSPDYHDLIGLIYEAVNNSEGFFPFLQRFVEVFEGHSASLMVYDTNAEMAIGHWTINIPEHALAFYAEHIAHQDALINSARAMRAQGKLRFVASNLDLGENAQTIREQTRAGEWLASFGADEAAGAIAFQSRDYLNFFGMQRSTDQPPFTREELAVFDLFLPHITRAVALYTEMNSLTLAHNPERLALNSIQRGILICDASFRIVYRNDTAARLIAANADLNLSGDGLLSFRDKAFSKHFMNSVSSAVHASVGRSDAPDVVLSYRSSRQNLTVTISPLAAANDQSLEEHRGGAILSIYDWSSRPSVSLQTLEQHFGLTEAEARISSLLAQGESIGGIAQTIHRSRETVKSHLKSVFRKTNTARQGELVALLSASCAIG